MLIIFISITFSHFILGILISLWCSSKEILNSLDFLFVGCFFVVVHLQYDFHGLDYKDILLNSFLSNFNFTFHKFTIKLLILLCHFLTIFMPILLFFFPSLFLTLFLVLLPFMYVQQLWPVGQIWPMTCFCKQSFIGTQLHSLVYIFCAIMTELSIYNKECIVHKLKLFIIWSFTEKRLPNYDLEGFLQINKRRQKFSFKKNKK